MQKRARANALYQMFEITGVPFPADNLVRGMRVIISQNCKCHYKVRRVSNNRHSGYILAKYKCVRVDADCRTCRKYQHVNRFYEPGCDIAKATSLCDIAKGYV